MPLFGNKFTPKKTPPRKSPSLSNLSFDNAQQAQEFGLDTDLPIKIKLGQNEVFFDDGQWIAESGQGGGASHKDLVKVRKQNQQLIEENNLLKIKLEILLDMLSETTAETHLQQREIENMKSMVKKKR